MLVYSKIDPYYLRALLIQKQSQACPQIAGGALPGAGGAGSNFSALVHTAAAMDKANCSHFTHIVTCAYSC